MSRSGYSEDWDGENWTFIRWRGAVKSALRGKRGQAFLREALAALDAMPEKRLITHDLIAFEYDPLVRWLFAPVVEDPEEPWRNWQYVERWRDIFDAPEAGVCLLGAVGVARGTPMAAADPEDHESVARLFDIPHALACEIMWENDEAGAWVDDAPAARWERMRRWIVRHIKGDQPEASDVG